MMSKHTPGPWVAIPAAERFMYEGNDLTSVVVCTDWTRGDANANGAHYRPDPSCVDNITIMDQFIRDLSLEEANANAHLIAASPELLEACEGLIELIDAARMETLCQGSEWVAKLAKVRAAVAKAKGGE